MNPAKRYILYVFTVFNWLKWKWYNQLVSPHTYNSIQTNLVNIFFLYFTPSVVSLVVCLVYWINDNIITFLEAPIRLFIRWCEYGSDGKMFSITRFYHQSCNLIKKLELILKKVVKLYNLLSVKLP